MIASMHQKLEQDFPGLGDEARLMARASLYFSKLADDYLAVCHEVDVLLHTGQESDGDHLHQAHKRRLVLKAEIGQRLRDARNHQTPMLSDAPPPAVALAP